MTADAPSWPSPEPLSDADCLRRAARILQYRVPRQTFAVRVIQRVLARLASRIEAAP